MMRQNSEDVEPLAVLATFAQTFQAFLPARIQRIDLALNKRNREKTVVALLSLQASAAIVCARQLDPYTGKLDDNYVVYLNPFSSSSAGIAPTIG